MSLIKILRSLFWLNQLGELEKIAFFACETLKKRGKFVLATWVDQGTRHQLSPEINNPFKKSNLKLVY